MHSEETSDVLRGGKRTHDTGVFQQGRDSLKSICTKGENRNDPEEAGDDTYPLIYEAHE